MQQRSLHNGTDQYYTNPMLADELLEHTLNVLKERESGKGKSFTFIEPAAGDGAFVKALEKRNLPFSAFDIDPKYPNIAKTDFLQSTFLYAGNNSVITI